MIAKTYLTKSVGLRVASVLRVGSALWRPDGISSRSVLRTNPVVANDRNPLRMAISPAGNRFTEPIAEGPLSNVIVLRLPRIRHVR